MALKGFLINYAHCSERNKLELGKITYPVEPRTIPEYPNLRVLFIEEKHVEMLNFININYEYVTGEKMESPYFKECCVRLDSLK